jgi:erythromycin esterase-like protein
LEYSGPSYGSYFRKSNGISWCSAKGIIWEHNTHIGDARATDMCDDGTVNVGQIINEEHKPEVFSVGFGSYKGTVIAGRSGEGWYAGYEVLKR